MCSSGLCSQLDRRRKRLSETQTQKQTETYRERERERARGVVHGCKTCVAASIGGAGAWVGRSTRRLAVFHVFTCFYMFLHVCYIQHTFNTRLAHSNTGRQDMTVKIDSSSSAIGFVDRYNTFLFDCDGVVWVGDTLLPHVKETMQLLQSKKKDLVFVSNNSTKSRQDYIKKLSANGIENIAISQIINSAYSTAIYIEQVLKLSKNCKIWVLGKSGITDELHNLGYETLTYDDLEEKFDKEALNMNNINELIDNSVGCVVVGLDFDLTYLKLSITLQYLIKTGKDRIPFIATNIDSTFPFQNTKLPGAGSIVQTVSFASSRDPDAVCGKPNKGMMDSILAHHNLDKSRTVMVGDRLNTDMKFGSSNGIDTLLVLTGIELESTVQDGHPLVTYYANRLGDLHTLSATGGN